VLVLVLLAWTLISMTGSAPIPPEPSPNGYYDFAKAGALITDKVSDHPDLDEAGLRELVTTNSEALKMMRLGFTKECAVPIAVLTNFPGTSLGDLPHLKRLAQLLAAEGRLAELENRPADAARSYTEAIRLGNEISRRGVLIFRLVGIAIESIGATPLAKLTPRLDPKQALPVLEELQKIDRSHVAWPEVRRSERMFMRQELSKLSPLVWPQGLWQNWQTTRKCEPRHQQVVARLRLLALELALRCYVAEQGKPPASLNELAPRYLHSVPLDPFTDQPLVYSAEGTNWLLYSVGPDRTDDGGKRAPRAAKKGDVFSDQL